MSTRVFITPEKCKRHTAIKKMKTILLFENIADKIGLSVWRDRTRGQNNNTISEGTLQFMYQIIYLISHET